MILVALRGLPFRYIALRLSLDTGSDLRPESKWDTASDIDIYYDYYYYYYYSVPHPDNPCPAI